MDQSKTERIVVVESIKQREGRFLLYGAVYLYIEKDGKILLQKRRNTGWQDDKYTMVTGHIDGGMTLAEEIAREAKEEVNLTIEPNDLRVVYIAHQIGSNGREYFCIYLKADKWTGEPENLEPDFCSELSWYQLDELPENIQSDILLAINNIQKGIFFSEFDWGKL